MISLIGEHLTSGNPAQIVAAALLLLGGVVFAVCGTALAFIDVREHRLPNRIIYPWAGITLALLLLVTFLLTDAAGLGRAMVAGLGWGLLFFLISWIHPPSIGMGDAKLAVILGLYTGFLGWEVFGLALVIAFVTAGLVSIWLLSTRRASSTSRIAFGPFLIAGTAVSLVLT